MGDIKITIIPSLEYKKDKLEYDQTDEIITQNNSIKTIEKGVKQIIISDNQISNPHKNQQSKGYFTEIINSQEDPGNEFTETQILNLQKGKREHPKSLDKDYVIKLEDQVNSLQIANGELRQIIKDMENQKHEKEMEVNKLQNLVLQNYGKNSVVHRSLEKTRSESQFVCESEEEIQIHLPSATNPKRRVLIKTLNSTPISKIVGGVVGSSVSDILSRSISEEEGVESTGVSANAWLLAQGQPRLVTNLMGSEGGKTPVQTAKGGERAHVMLPRIQQADGYGPGYGYRNPPSLSLPSSHMRGRTQGGMIWAQVTPGVMHVPDLAYPNLRPSPPSNSTIPSSSSANTNTGGRRALSPLGIYSEGPMRKHSPPGLETASLKYKFIYSRLNKLCPLFPAPSDNEGGGAYKRAKERTSATMKHSPRNRVPLWTASDGRSDGEKTETETHPERLTETPETLTETHTETHTEREREREIERRKKGPILEVKGRSNVKVSLERRNVYRSSPQPKTQNPPHPQPRNHSPYRGAVARGQLPRGQLPRGQLPYTDSPKHHVPLRAPLRTSIRPPLSSSFGGGPDAKHAEGGGMLGFLNCKKLPIHLPNSTPSHL